MSKRALKIKIDLAVKEYQEITLKQLDTTQIQFEVLENNQKYSLKGLTANLIFLKPTNKVVIQSAQIDDTNSIVTANLNMDCVRVSGRAKVEVELKQGEETISSFQVIANVEPTGKDSFPSEDEESFIESVDKSLKKVEECVKKETERVTAEKQRVENEKNRAAAEKVREENEKTREKNATVVTNIITISQLIPAETEYTLPCNYKVGNHSLRVHWENVLLEEGENGNYMEVGDKDSISNKIKFGWDIEVGETLIIEVRGVVDE